MTRAPALRKMRRMHTDLESTRASIARELSAYYSELAGAAAKPPPKFSLARLLSQMSQPHGLRDGYERELAGAAAAAAGESFDQHRAYVPLGALVRDMSAAGVSGSNYLVGSTLADPVDVLRPWSVVARAGITVMPGLVGNLLIPRVSSAASAAWTTEGSQFTETQPTVGQSSLTPKHAAATIDFTHSWRQQAEAAEPLLRAQLLRAVGELLDAAFFSGSGASGQPAGLLLQSTGTQSGTSLAHAGVLAMRKTALNAGAQEDRLRWVGPPTIQELLGSRERASGGGRFLWDADGILGRPAHSTKNAPASTLVLGDFSAAVLGIFGPLAAKVEVNPYADFSRGLMSARIIIQCDYAFPQPGAFVVASSVT